MTISISQQNVSERLQDREVVLTVNGVSKKFCRDLNRSLFYGMKDIASELTGLRKKFRKLRPKEFWALQNVSFELRQGEALGLVGRNGSGKSTLLRIIAGLIKPDAGSVEINGTVAPLIALGAGFNPILTGRENIYANMSILGLSKQEIDERFDAVVDFAEVDEAIDAPVQSYSSGMKARLGFASAIHTEPEILLIDEVLAVGDIRFRQKCFHKLYELRQKGTSFILVSHNSQAILNVCDSSIYLLKGKLMASGDTNSVMSQYEEELFFNGIDKVKGAMFLPDKPENESSGLDIAYLLFRNEQGNILESPITREFTRFCVGCKAHKKFDGVGLILIIREIAGESDVVLFMSSANEAKPLEVFPGESEIQVQMPYLCLRQGSYTMRVIVRKEAFYPLDTAESFRFTVDCRESVGRSLFYQPRTWEIIRN